MNAKIVKILSLKQQQHSNKLQQRKIITKEQADKLNMLKSYNFGNKNHEYVGILRNNAHFKQNLYKAINVQQQQIIKCKKKEQQSLDLWHKTELTLNVCKENAHKLQQNKQKCLSKKQQNYLQQLVILKKYAN